MCKGWVSLTWTLMTPHIMGKEKAYHQEVYMKRFIAVTVLIAIGSLAFALGNREQLTEEEALALIDQKVAELQLTLEESEAAEQAFLAILAAGGRIKQALAVVTKALDDGLEAEAMNEIAVQMRARIGEELSAGKSEAAAREMAQEKVRELRGGQSDDDDEEDGGKPETLPAGSPGPAVPGTPATTPGKRN
jgi:hypothetical protein